MDGHITFRTEFCSFIYSTSSIEHLLSKSVLGAMGNTKRTTQSSHSEIKI